MDMPSFRAAALAVGVAQVIASARAALMTMILRSLLAGIVHMAWRIVRSVILERIAAERTGIHALVVAVMLTVALGVAAVAADIMLRAHVRLALHGVNTGTMVRVITRSFVTAEAPVAPEQAAHAARSVRIRAGAQIHFTAAAVVRITEVLRVTLTRHMVRRGVAVLADGLGIVTAAGAGIVAFNAAGSHVVVLAVAVVVAGDAAGSGAVSQAVACAVAVSAAGRGFMLETVAIGMSLLAANRTGVLHTVAVVVSGDVAVRQIMAHLITAVVTGKTTGRVRMLSSVGHAMPGDAAGGRFMAVTVIADKVFRRTAGRGGVILSVTGKVAVDLALGAAMIAAVTVGMAVHPAGPCAVMVKAVVLIMALDAAGRRRTLLRNRRSAKQHAQRQQQSKQLFHCPVPPRSSRTAAGTIHAFFIIHCRRQDVKSCRSF